MSKHNTVETALDEIKDAIQEGIDRNGGEFNLFVSTGQKKERMNLVNPFAFLFYENLLDIIDECNLSRLEIRAILKILSYMEFGNLVRMSYSQLMRDIGSDPSNGSKVIKRLREAKVLVEVNGNTYLNPHLILKGRIKSKDAASQEVIERAADELVEFGVSPSVMTKGLEVKMKAKEKTNSTL